MDREGMFDLFILQDNGMVLQTYGKKLILARILWWELIVKILLWELIKG